jgi:hypothetical protein
MKDGQPCKQVEVVAIFDHDSKNFHAFNIREINGITGSIYISKDCQGIPNVVTVRLRTSAEADPEPKEEKK